MDNQNDLLTIKEVECLVTLKKSTIYDMIKRSEFPPQRKIGKRAARWLRSDINKWKESKFLQ